MSTTTPASDVPVESGGAFVNPLRFGLAVSRATARARRAIAPEAFFSHAMPLSTTVRLYVYRGRLSLARDGVPFSPSGFPGERYTFFTPETSQRLDYEATVRQYGKHAADSAARFSGRVAS